MQVSCVSGAQLSNYATFLIHPDKAALSIVLTALSTAAGVVVTPLLVLLLLGQRIPVDVKGMAVSIMQIVILPVGIGEANAGHRMRVCIRVYGYILSLCMPILQLSHSHADFLACPSVKHRCF